MKTTTGTNSTPPPCADAHRGHVDRRAFLTASLAAGALVSMGVSVGSVAYGASLTQAERDKLTPDEIIALMKRGNERFRRGENTAHDYLAQQKASAAGQFPAAVILSCVDSRAAAEIILDLGIGDVFNARVAGNIAGEDVLGSMEFACKISGAKVAVVMGHTGCGAIKGAIANVELGNLTGLLAKIRPAVAATQYQGERSATNYAFVDAVARTNVELTVRNISRSSPVLAGLEAAGTIDLVGAMYDLNTGAVDFFVT